MPLPAPPSLDDRRYREILDEALARVPVHTPEWSSLGDSDPGVTLLQLFAFLYESLAYRANRIPERNRQKFLRLLGIGLEPAAPARGLVAFENARKPPAVVTLDRDLELAAGKVAFRTDDGLQVLPVEAGLFYKARLPQSRAQEATALYQRLYASFRGTGQEIELYETRAFEPATRGAALATLDLGTGTVDGLWLALLAPAKSSPEEVRTAIGGQVLTVGVVPALEGAVRTLYPAGPPAAADRPRLVFEVPNLAAGTTPRYRPLPARFEDDPLARPTVVELRLPPAEELGTWTDLDPLEAGTGAYPPSLADTGRGAEELEDRVVTWIRIRAQAADGGGTGVEARLSWVGVNAARVVQLERVTGERLPDGTGEPGQVVRLVRAPVLPETLSLTVGGESWRPIDSLAAAPPEVPARGDRGGPAGPDAAKVFQLDPESGEVRFGDGAHGMRPPRGSRIVASYATGGGQAGVVEIGAVNKGPLLPAGVKVSNPVPTWGGDDGETVAEAEQRIPAFLRHRDRLVTAEDVEEVTRRTPGVEIGRVEVLPLVHPQQPDQAAEGVVTVLVIPARDPVQPAAPRPDRLFLDTVCAYLEPRRIVTTELHVTGPEYVGVWVSVGIEPVPGRDEGPVRERVSRELERFLSPLAGGFGGDGWPLGKAVDALELSAAVARVEGVAKVVGLSLSGTSGGGAPQVPLGRLQLPRLLGASVSAGDARPLDEVKGQSDPDGAGGAVRIPVPVIPEEC